MSTTVKPIQSTHVINMDVVQGASWVGQQVTDGHNQWRVHSVEGVDWYAFNQDGRVSVDQHMTPDEWHTVPTLTLLPDGAKFGQGLSVSRKLGTVRRGVSLVKSWV